MAVWTHSCLVPAAGAEVLGDGHHRSGRQAGEDAHRQVDDDGGGAHGSARPPALALTHHQGVHRIAELLEKGAEPQGEEKGEELFPGSRSAISLVGWRSSPMGDPSIFCRIVKGALRFYASCGKSKEARRFPCKNIGRQNIPPLRRQPRLDDRRACFFHGIGYNVETNIPKRGFYR